MRESIQLHPKYGLNPSCSTCFYCNEPNEILLVGSQTRKFREAGVPVSADGQMPMQIGVIDMRPCSKCEGYMKQGIILISVRDGEENKIGKPPNPYRTGGWVVIKEDSIDRAIDNEELRAQIKKARFCFIPDEAWMALGLPELPKKED